MIKSKIKRGCWGLEGGQDPGVFVWNRGRFEAARRRRAHVDTRTGPV